MTEVFPFFLYGTARVGQPLHEYLEPVCAAWNLAMAPGAQLMMKPGNTAYPYLVSRRPAEDPYVYGDLCLLRRGDRLRKFVSMEIDCGYNLEAIPVSHSIKGWPKFAFAFMWPSNDDDLVPLGFSSWIIALGKPRSESLFSH